MMLKRPVSRRWTLVLMSLCIAAVCVYLRLLPSSAMIKFRDNSFNNHDEIQDDLIDVVLTFPLLTDTNWNNPSYRHLTYPQRETRMQEYLVSVQNTLAHPRVGRVHCLYDQTELVAYVRKKIVNKKLKFHYINQTQLALSAFRFVFRALHGRLVMVIQADTYPAQGFQHVIGDRMRKKRLFYALTRHGRMEANCDMRGDFCDVREYIGSHDAYIFVPTGVLSARHSDILNKRAMSWGIDLVIAWVFRDMGYRVLNPCKVIFIYHLHCSWVRDIGRIRVNTVNNTGWFPPTWRLG